MINLEWLPKINQNEFLKKIKSKNNNEQDFLNLSMHALTYDQNDIIEKGISKFSILIFGYS